MRVITRAEWGATAKVGAAMRLPADELWVHHSVTRPDSIVADMLELERIGVARFGRFSYSYAVHPSGEVAEGAGLTIGAHTAGRNSHSLGVVAIGNYETTDPTPELLEAIAQLTVLLIYTGALKPGTYPTGGHRDAAGASTACPGARLYARLPEIRARIDTLLHPAPPAPVEVSPMDFVDQLSTPEGDGCWILLADGAVHTGGNAAYFGGANQHMQPGDRATDIRPHAGGLYGYTILTVQSPTAGFTYPADGSSGTPKPPVNQHIPPQTNDPGLVARLAACERSREIARGLIAEAATVLS